MAKHVLFCGCGWLGKYAAKSLISSGFTVSGSTRTEDKSLELKALGITPTLFSLGDSPTALFNDVPDCLVLNVPPGRRSAMNPNYTALMQGIVDTATQAGVKHIIFISTTSVYGAIEHGDVDAATPLQPNTESGIAHKTLEDYLARHAKGFDIVRLSGLVGPDRHPINTLSGRTLDKGNQVTNLIYVDDIVDALAVMIKRGPRQDHYILSSLEQPKRADYYTFCARKKGLEAPVFEGYSTEQLPSGKRINSLKSWEKLGLTPNYASPYDMI